MKLLPPVSIEARRLLPGPWDVLAVLLVFGFIVLLADASRGVEQPLSGLSRTPLSLDPIYLPEYALRTALRMLVAMGFSLVFTLSYATWAAKSRRAETVLVPLLDILQSVPILGFISVTVTFFLSLAPGKILGAELAAVFAIFTSQAWNMAFSFYQSLRTVPTELTEAGKVFGLSAWARFWRIETPFGMPALIWNMMMSMSGGWFFVTLSEAITVGPTTVALPGIGSYIATAIAAKSLSAIGWAVLAMLIVILIYDQLLFRPLVSWADRFRIDTEPGDEADESWALTMYRKARLFGWLGTPFNVFMQWTYKLAPPKRGLSRIEGSFPPLLADIVWYTLLAVLGGLALWKVVAFTGTAFSLAEITDAFLRGLATMVRVIVLIAIASVVWTPIGIYVGLSPRLTHIIQPIAQFLAAFPSNLLFPFVVSAIVALNLNANIWLSPLMILGTQWYILFNVIAGASALPHELRDAADNFQIKGWLWWKKVALPAVFPYYVTGAITASGGSWNAAVQAEIATWGANTLVAYGLGSYITKATTAGNFHQIVLGIAVMCFYVVVVNRLFWRPLYWYAERKYRLT
jgi:NitT/TauT family transport system permease protein